MIIHLFLQFIEACSHGRSWKLFVNTILSEFSYIASECSSWDFLKIGNCKGNEIAMGENTPLTARGIYYIKTTGSAPYISFFDSINDLINQ